MSFFLNRGPHIVNTEWRATDRWSVQFKPCQLYLAMKCFEIQTGHPWSENQTTVVLSSLNNVLCFYVTAAVTPTQPSATLLRVDNDLVCLVTGFSPAHINISWFLDNATELIDYNTSEAFRGPDGKYSVQSRLQLAPMDQLPGAVHTCRVTHATATVDVHISQKGE
uniref:Ig-like domain-containing protein n=1 Tax=Neogobius melanostomus TaxID=47308 RepID=A0A8C6WLM4_9GOBI